MTASVLLTPMCGDNEQRLANFRIASCLFSLLLKQRLALRSQLRLQNEDSQGIVGR